MNDVKNPILLSCHPMSREVPPPNNEGSEYMSNSEDG